MKENCQQLKEEFEKMQLFLADFYKQFEDALEDENFKDAKNSAYAFGLCKKTVDEIVFAFGLEEQRIKFGKQLRSKSSKSFLKRSEVNVASGKIVVEGDLKLTKKRYDFLPEHLFVRGHLEIAECNITALPEGLVVEGNFMYNNNSAVDIPENLVVHGTLTIDGSKLTEAQRKKLKKLEKDGYIKELMGIPFRF